MRISIVTPSYNQAPYLPTCLRSVSGQTHRDVEHLVMDGGSTDGSLDVLRAFQARDSRLRFVSEPDKGQGDAVNKGFALVTGDIVAWINSDDFYFSPTVFETVVGLFEQHPEADVLYGGMAWVDAQDRLLHVRIPPSFNWPLLTRIVYIGNTNAFYRRAVIEKHKIDLRYHYVLDHEYLLRITRDFRPLRTRQVLACFRVQPAAKTQVMAESAKNSERRLRNADHGVEALRPPAILAGWERVQYRCVLWASDAIYRSRWRRNPPYRMFLT